MARLLLLVRLMMAAARASSWPFRAMLATSSRQSAAEGAQAGKFSTASYTRKGDVQGTATVIQVTLATHRVCL
jgi:hypothetical protein